MDLAELFPGSSLQSREKAADRLIAWFRPARTPQPVHKTTRIPEEVFSRTVPVDQLVECRPIPEHGPAIEGCVIPVVTKIERKQTESEKLQEDLEPLP